MLCGDLHDYHGIWQSLGDLKLINENQFMKNRRVSISTSETIKSSALSLKSIYNVHSGDCLSSGVLGVCNCISDNLFKEGSEDSSGVVVDEAGDSFNTTSSAESSDCWFSDTIDCGSG